jgi:hypothetical protein
MVSATIWEFCLQTDLIGLQSSNPSSVCALDHLMMITRKWLKYSICRETMAKILAAVACLLPICLADQDTSEELCPDSNVDHGDDQFIRVRGSIMHTCAYLTLLFSL